MMKKLRFLFVAFMAMVGLNVMAQEVTLDFTPTDNPWGIPTSGTNKDEASFTNGGYTIKLKANDNYKSNVVKDQGTQEELYRYLILGKKNSTLTLPAFSFDVEKIVIEGNSGASGAVKQNIFVGETAVSTETTGAQTTNTYLISKDYQAAGNVYVLKITSAHNTQITKIHIYKSSGVSVPEISGDEIFQGSTQVTVTADEGANIFYTTDGTEPSSNSLAYTAPFTIDQSCVVKAVAEKGGALSSVVSKTFTKTVGDGTQDNPYTCADMLSLPKGYEATGKWVKGIIVGSISNNKIEETPSVTTNLAMAAAAGETELTNAVPVQLMADKNKDALNVVDNPSNIGKELVILGDITSYFSCTGLKNTSNYILDGVLSGVNTVIAEQADENAPVYNLAGQRVNKNYKGVVIQNGHKFIVK